MSISFSVLIPDGEDPLSLLVTRCLAQAGGIEVYLFSNRGWTLARYSRHIRGYRFSRVGDDQEARLAAVSEMIRRHQIDVLMPVGEPGIEFVTTHRAALAPLAAICPVPKVEALKTAIDKWSLYQFARRQNVRVPPAVLVTEGEGVYDRAATLNWPVLLKPTAKAGGKGIEYLQCPSDLGAYLENEERRRLLGQCMIQEYVPGQDLGLSVLCQDGQILAYTVQQGLLAHRFSQLKAMRFVEQQDVLEQGRRLLAALRWSGVAHIDMRYDTRDQLVKVLEVNGRYWGSLMGSLVAGVNFPYLASMAALGTPFAMPGYEFRAFFHKVPALQEGLRNLLHRGRYHFGFRETSWPYMLRDPAPEAANMMERLVHRLRSRFSKHRS